MGITHAKGTSHIVRHVILVIMLMVTYIVIIIITIMEASHMCTACTRIVLL